MNNKPLLPYFAGIALLTCGTFFTSQAFAQSSAPEEKVYSYVDGMPAFEGGDTEMLNFIASNMQYPQEAREAGVKGVAIVSFIVETNGSLSDIKLEKSISASIDAEAKRLASLTEGKWSIGKHKGKPTRVKYLLPIKFSLDGSGNPAMVHKMPSYKGGQEAMVRTIYQNLKVPAAAKKESLNARLQVNFTIDPAGNVSNITVADTKLKKVVGAGANMNYMDASTFKVQNKAVLAELHKAAAEAIKATDGLWEPGIRNGKAIAAEVTLPVLFSASGEANVGQQLETMSLAYQADAYDKQFSYEASEVDAKPTLTDGPIDQFLAKHLRYPNSSFEGTVRVAFLVNSDGRIVGPMADLKEEHQVISDEIKRVFKLTEGLWIPAKKNTQPVTAMQEMTIAFLPKDTKEQPSRPIAADVVVTK